MTEKAWKITAIIFIVLFVLETAFWTWAMFASIAEEETKYECYYDVCSDTYDAYYENNICTCYDLDTLGQYIVTKEKYMK